MGQQTNWTRITRGKFLERLSETGSVTDACALSGLPRSTAYQLRHADAGFSTAWDSALQMGADSLEDEAKRRAMDKSDFLLVFLLKGLRPEKYRDRTTVNVNRIGRDYEGMTRAQLRVALDQLRAEQQDDAPAISDAAAKVA